jgi:CcmD family protein
MVRKIRTFIGVAIMALLLGAASAAQQQPPPQPPPAQTGFETMSPEDQAREVLPATPFVFTAYAIVWLVLMGYIFLLWRRVAKVERELTEVNVRLTGSGPRP